MNRIKEARLAKGLTQKQLGDLVGWSYSTISLYESGGRKPEPETLLTLANILGVSTDYLLGRDDEQDTKKEPAIPDRLDDALIEMLVNLSPEEAQRVQDFVSGPKGRGFESHHFD